MSVLLSVIIPTCHRNDLLALCLNQLAPNSQTLSYEYYEVIVTDDGIKSTAEELIKTDYPWVKWVQGPRKGPAANRNFGAKQASGEWFVFVDDDCIPEYTLLVAYKNAIFLNIDTKVFEGRIYVDRPKARHDEESPINETGGYLWSCNFCIQKHTFDSLNGFNQTFPYAAMEDADFHYRLIKNQYNILFINKAGVMHPWRKCKGYGGEKKRLDSTFHYLKLHPEEKNRINVIFYVRSIYHEIRDFFLLFPTFFFKGAGYLLVRIYVHLLGLFKRMIF